MATPLRVGLMRRERIRVDCPRTIDFLGEQDRVYSTPSMVNDVEYACWRLLQAHIESTQTSLGVSVSLRHLAATPLGDEVTISVRVEELQGHKVGLSAEVTDCVGVVGRGEHQRVIVDLQRHRSRLAQRRAQSLGPHPRDARQNRNDGCR